MITGKSNAPIGIVTFQLSGERKRMRCDICLKYPNIVRQFNKGKPPPITCSDGARYRPKYYNEHSNTPYHIECVKAHRLQALRDEDNVATEQMPLEISIGKANRRMVNHVGKLMLQVYHDAKLLNMSAYSWPSRYVAMEASHAYDSESRFPKSVPHDVSLQYVRPAGHLQLMSAIVRSYQSAFMEKMLGCLAISLRIDGSIDFTQLDKIYIMASIINTDGSSEIAFLGISEQTQRFAAGLMSAVIEGIKVNNDNPDELFARVSSICTDGTNLNTGEKNSLWQLLEKKLRDIQSKIPLIKIWCSAHRAELAWKDAAKDVRQVGKVLSTLTSISTYFHFSAFRTAELKNIAKDNAIPVRKLPKLFEVRWSQFTFSLVRNVLLSWKCLVLYFNENRRDAACAGFHRYLTKWDNLRIIGLLGDILFKFSKFQKKLQSERLTLISMEKFVSDLVNSLAAMSTSPMVGGFESQLTAQVTTDPDGKMYYKEIEVTSSSRSRRNQEEESFEQTRKKIIESLQKFLRERFQVDQSLLRLIAPFVTFKREADVVAVHRAIAPDLSLANLSHQFEEILLDLESSRFDEMNLSEILLRLRKTHESRANFKEVSIVLARIAACTPNSADVERSISKDNLLKTKLRSSMNISTENVYMFINYNMPDLDDWKPTAAAQMFIAEKERRESSATTSSKSREQPYFNGVFGEARKCNDAELRDDTDEDDFPNNI